MANEKYLNYYIECLTSTMTDCVVRNISMQANAKITDDVIQEQSKKIEDMLSVLNEKQKEIESFKTNKINNENNLINDLNNRVNQKDSEITRITNEINELKNKYKDYDNIKNQATHVDTFRKELVKSREETNNLRDDYEKKIDVLIKKYDKEKEVFKKQILDLNAKIDYLQLPPAKRKKIDGLNKEVVVSPAIETGDVSEDGGTF